jgi:periplasmic protein TonB
MYAATLTTDQAFDASDWEETRPTATRPTLVGGYERGEGYGARRRLNPIAIAVMVIVHVALLAALLQMGFHRHLRRTPQKLEIVSIQLAPVPPAQAVRPPEHQQQKVVQTPIVAETPIVQSVSAPPPVMVSPSPQPTVPAPAASAAPVAAPVAVQSGPVAIGKLSPMAGNPPLKYPMSSRMKREQGVVRLRIIVGTNGSIDDITIAESSGFDSLDKAAIDVVRKWRFYPPTRDGVPVQGVGIFPAAFKLA